MAFFAGGLVAVLWMTMAGAGGAPTGHGGEGGSGGGHAKGPRPATVRVAQAKLQNLRPRLAVVGRLREVRLATVAAEVEGKVLEVTVREGDPVVGGETVLARIDGVWAELDLARTQADVAAAQATLDQSELNLAYLEQLLQAQSAKPKEVEDKRAQVASDRARLSSAVANRDRIKKELERVEVVAPFDGFVTRKITEAGQWVDQGDDIVEVISKGQIDAVADVPEHLIDSIKVGDVAEVMIEPLKLPVRGEVIAINPDGGNSARTFPVKVKLDDLEGRLKSGMSVTVWLPVGTQTPVLTVPRDAVLYSLSGQTVWVGMKAGPGGPPSGPPVSDSSEPGPSESDATESDASESDASASGPPKSGPPPMPSAMPVPVRVLFGEGDRAVVEPISNPERSLLADGATVIIEGAETLFPTQPLIYANDQTDTH